MCLSRGANIVFLETVDQRFQGTHTVNITGISLGNPHRTLQTTAAEDARNTQHVHVSEVESAACDKAELSVST